MERNSPESAYSSAKLGQRLLRWWGFLFRAILISGIGLGAYLFADPPSIADRAISSLTLRDISDNIFAYGIAFGCLLWFLSFPSESDADQVLSYEDWGKFGGYTCLGLALVTWLIVGNK